jgi:hypothetical protein
VVVEEVEEEEQEEEEEKEEEGKKKKNKTKLIDGLVDWLLNLSSPKKKISVQSVHDP